MKQSIPVSIEIDTDILASDFDEAKKIVLQILPAPLACKAKVYYNAHIVHLPPRKPAKQRSNRPQSCTLLMNTANGRNAQPLVCKSISEAVRIAHESDLYFYYRVIVNHRVVRSGYCGRK